MQQSFEFYKVDPATWHDSEIIENIKSCTINRDSDDATLGSASIDCTNTLEECYVRTYLVVIQNGVKYRVPLGTHLVQTPSVAFDGKTSSVTLDGYTPLIELKGTKPPIGYSVLEGEKIMGKASKLCQENLRAPVVAVESEHTLYSDFVADTSEDWISFLSYLISNAKYSFDLDDMGRILFAPNQDIASLQSVWTYNDDNSSILYPDISHEQDLYSIPNVVEVIYSTGSGFMMSRIVNDDVNSPVSVTNRGREVLYRETSPSILSNPTQEYLDDYAVQLLRNLSCLEHKVTYTHGYCPVRVGDCVTLNYKRAGLNNVRAKVTNQSIKCETGCSVEETAVWTENLWR